MSGNLLSESHMGAAQCALAPGARDPAQVQTTRYTYEERFNQLKTHTDPLGNTTTYVYDYEEGVGEAGKLIRVEYPPVANENGIPFFPVVPTSTVDLSLPTGDDIPIEERDGSEVTELTLFGRPVAPKGARVGNPAFDVTPRKYVTGIVTEHSVVYPPYDINLRRAVEAEQAKIGKK